MTTALLRTPLHDWHQTHGGRMVDFAGWVMPVQYASIVDEHLAVRRAAGMFDVSHMGRLTVAGPGAAAWLEEQLTRRVAGMARGRVRYTLVAAEDAAGTRILDDALVVHGPVVPGDAAADTWGLVVNAGNRQRVVEWLRSRLPAAGVRLVERTAETAMIAVQGPAAVGIVASLAPAADRPRLEALGGYTSTVTTLAGVPAAASRTGYTGEDGFEVVVDATAAQPVWEALLGAGAAAGLVPCGLGARDTLRLEAGMPLYGHELVEDSDPYAIGLGLAVDLEGRRFPGSETFRAAAGRPPAQVRVGIVFEGRRAAREGSLVTAGNAACGRVTSGSYVPSLGRAVAMALVDARHASPGTAVDVVVRDSGQPGTVVALPFYRRPRPAAG
ncbi:MAG: glycine cleavage system aminomethyltransferase GcvT [Planctomycetota bacterium]